MAYDITWSALTPGDFEEFAFWLITALGYEEPRRVSGPGDQGEDVVAFFPAFLPGVPLVRRKWVFQCKHVRRVTKLDIEKELSNFAAGEIDTWVLVTTARETTSMRTWLQQIRGTERYPFHIETWWQDDLERITRENLDALLRYVPLRLNDKLGLYQAVPVPSTANLAAVAARCRDFSNSQIERYARGKYIPNLYVHRNIQSEIQDFLADEATIAHMTKTSILELVRKTQTQLDNGVSHFRKSFRDVPQAETKPDEKVRQQHLRRFRTQLLDESESWLIEIRRSLLDLSRSAELLSDDKYVVESEKYLRLETQAKKCLELLATIPRREEPVEIIPVLEGRPREPALVSVLSEGGFDHNVEESLKSAIVRANAPFKPSVLIIDRAGSGKTNVVCHLVTRIAEEKPVLLLFGRQPILGNGFLVSELTARVRDVLDREDGDPMAMIDSILADNGEFLSVFIDGINENRDLQVYDAELSRLLTWSSKHRIKVVLTCRDIYWSFFNADEWIYHVQHIIREEIREFSPSEYEAALPLYLAHYHISCELADEARRACQHPLLLRFFCEAYGSIQGPAVRLGEMRDIRLKELFDVYLEKKTDQIRRDLGEQNPHRVRRYLFQLATYLFHNRTSTMELHEVSDATGESDLSSQSSLYVHLLGEDIIIDEQPGQLRDRRQMTFVYEEFLEYLLARALMASPQEFGINHPSESFELLDTLKTEWANARGVGEYVCLMLLQAEPPEMGGISYLRQFADSDSDTWREAYWSILGKLPISRIDSDVLDTLALGLRGVPNERVIRQTLVNMSRYSTALANDFAAALLWSAALPPVISWRFLEELPQMSTIETEKLGYDLVEQLSRPRAHAPGNLAQSKILDTALPFLSIEQQKIIQHFRRFATNANSLDAPTGIPMIEVLWKAFPHFAPMMLNGLYHQDEAVQQVCADRLRSSRICKSQLALIARMLATSLSGSRTGEILSQTAWRLRHPF